MPADIYENSLSLHRVLGKNWAYVISDPGHSLGQGTAVITEDDLRMKLKQYSKAGKRGSVTFLLDSQCGSSVRPSLPSLSHVP